MILKLKSNHFNLLKEEARRVYPVEACALLFGESTKEEAFVRKVVLAPNELHSSEKFEINPETIAKAFKDTKKEGLDFIGLFHSHTKLATPSTIDLKFMKLWGDAIWLICSLTDNKLAAYRLENCELKEVAIKTEKTNAPQLKTVVDSYMKKVSGVQEHCDRCLRTERWSGNIVLMVVDAAFTSIGLNYFTAVVPKVVEFDKKFVESRKITILRELAKADLTELRTVWRNQRSWTIAKNIAFYLSNLATEVDDTKAMRTWASNSSLAGWKKDPIGAIKGVGIVTFQYLRMMGGVDTVMPDKIVKRVINEILEKASLEPVDDNVEFVKKTEDIASTCGYRPIELCWMTWLVQPEGKTMRMKKYSNILSKI